MADVDISERLGGLEARTKGLEEDRRETRAELHDIRNILQRIELSNSRAQNTPQADPALMIAAQGIGRVADQLATQPPAQPLAPLDIAQAVAPLLKGGGVSTGGILGYVIGAASIAWTLARLFPGG